MGDLTLPFQRVIDVRSARVTMGAGLSWMAELTSKPREPVRAGIQLFGALAEHSHWGVALVLAFGEPSGRQAPPPVFPRFSAAGRDFPVAA